MKDLLWIMLKIVFRKWESYS